MRTRLRSWMYAALLACACCATQARTAHAQASAVAEERRPLQLALTQAAPPALDGEQLRAQLERELSVVVELRDEGTTGDGATTLAIDAPSLNAVRLAFGQSARTVDLSASGQHAVETLALVAANMMRDEASDLLASLRATTPEAPPPAPPPPPPATPPAATPEAPKEPEPTGCDLNNYKKVPFGVNLLPLVGTSSFTGRQIEQTISLNLIGGSAQALRGFELGGVFNHESHAVCGVQIAGTANIVMGPLTGVQLGGFNLVDGRIDGGQIAFINTSSGTIHGFQAAFLNLALRGGDAIQVGFANVVNDRFAGAQFGFGNVATGTVDGGQFGFANVSTGGVTGVQAGFVNVAHEELSGAQAGFVNTTAGDSTGFQLGFLNVTSGRSRGLMLGMANVSADADVAIGLLNIYTKGRTQLDLWATDAGLAMVGVVHGGRVFHNILGIGATARGGRGVFAFAYGFGARALQNEAMFLDVDALGYGLVTGDDTQNSNPDFGSILQLRVPIGFRLEPWLALYVSPALNLSVARSHESNSLRDPGFYGARVTTAGSAVASYIWPGVTLGARFF